MRVGKMSTRKMKGYYDILSKKKKRIIGGNPFLKDVEQGNKEQVKKYLAIEGADLNVIDSEGNTALKIAADNGHTEIVEMLIRAGVDLNVKNSTGDTALLEPALQGHEKIVKMLIDAGADLNVKNSAGETALLEAAGQGHEKIVQMFIDARADLNVVARDGNTALIWAARGGYNEIVKMLIDNGAGYADLMTAAAAKGDTERVKEIVKMLIDAGVDLNVEDSEGNTALIFAASRGHKEIVKILIDAGADVNVMDSDGDTALLEAAARGRKEIVKMLIDAGTHLNVIDSEGNFSLIYAAMNGYNDIAKMLIDAGADLNVEDLDGDTALIFAARGGYNEIVEMLIDAGPDLNVKNDKGNTALSVAAFYGHTIIAEMLIDVGADLNVKNSSGKTALKIAEARGHDEIAKLLRHGPKEMWAGWSRGNAAGFESIFAVNTDGGKIEAANTSVCPICLKTVVRSEGCVYIQGHNCSQLEGFYHKALYNKYKMANGFVTWCTICNRICDRHQHYKLGYASGDKPKLNPYGSPFTKDCAATEGGGGLLEKLGRFRRLREYALELNDYIGKMTKKKALEKLVEAMWDAPLTHSKKRLPLMMAAREWNIPSATFPMPPAVNAEPEIDMASLPDIPKPADAGGPPEIVRGKDMLYYAEGEGDVIKFHHKQTVGPNTGQVFHHDDLCVSKAGLETFITNINARYKQDGAFGLCWAFPGNCSGRLYPEEIEKYIDDKKLFNEYKMKFNWKFRAVAGGRKKSQKQRKIGRRQTKRGGGNNVFVPATNATCNVRPNKISRPSNK